ncbi:MAG: ATP-binding domain-containing protein, partial [Clostridiales bacterium]|nr:ATP-binding domain-containing protein [Clostridiales bacterium]
YSFRGATVRNILEFDEVFPDARVIKLEQNYRSTQNILSAANAVIQNNEGRKGKNLWTESEDGEKLLVKEIYSQTEEAMFIADSILERVAQGEKLSSFAVLYRTNAQSGALESAFTKARIPYRVFGGLRFYERKEIKDIVAYLSLIANPADDMRLTRIINVPKRAIGTATVENVARIAAAEGAPMLEIVRNASDYPALLKASLKLERFYALIADLADFAAEHSLSALVEEVLARTGYLDMLRSSPEDRDKEEIVQEFVSTAKLFEETGESAGLSAFLEDIALVSDTDTYDENAEAVSLMTVHSAKGLEFPYVFLPGFEDGLFPSSRALDNRESEEEERRLAYVAITRAKKALTILYTKSRVIYGRTEFCTPSRFLDEIPDDLLERETARPRPVVTNRRPAPDTARRSSTFGSAPERSTLSIAVGSRVLHPVFGEGVVVASQDMGNDTLLEVEFFSGQTKKLMQNYAKLKLK